MINPATRALISLLPPLTQDSSERLNQLTQQARMLELITGEALFRQGELCESYLILAEGSLRVQKTNNHGHEIVLQHVKTGEDCDLTNTFLLGGHHYPADVVAETYTKIILLSKPQFLNLIDAIPEFKAHVFKGIKHSMSDLFGLVEEVAFDQMDHRLANLLLKRMDDKNQLKATHQELAKELGSAREVISRILKEFEHQQWVKLHRGKVEVVNSQELAKI